MEALLVLMVIVALSFRNAGSIPVFVKPFKGSVFASVGKSAEFSFSFTGGFDKISFGPFKANNIETVISVTKATPLLIQHLPEYQERLIWAGNESVSPMKAVFILSNVSQDDSGKYDCRVTKDNIDADALVELIVTDASIVEHPKDVICQTFGDEVNFTCNATGTPHPNVTWVKGEEEEIGESSSFKIVRDNKGYSKLTINNCGREDVLTRYRCKATNPPDLEVFSKPAVLFFPFTANETAMVDKYSSPPMVHGSVGVETTLRCAFRSYPPPSINWTFPNGDSTRTQLPFLVIIPKSSEQFGQYTCNAEGFPSRTIMLTRETDDVPIINFEPASLVNLTWINDTSAKYYTVSGTDERSGKPFLAIVDNKTNEMTLYWKSEVTTENKGELNYTLEVRAIADSYNKVINRTRVILVSKARSLQAGFLAIVVALAVGPLSAGF